MISRLRDSRGHTVQQSRQMQLEVLVTYKFSLCLKLNSELCESSIVVRYLIIIIYKGSRGPNTKGPGRIYLDSTDIAIHRHTYQPDLAAQQPVSVRPVPATNQESLPQSTPTTSTLPGESVPAYRVVLLLSGTSSGRIAALRSIAILSGSRISDCPYTTHRRAQFSRVETRVAAGLRRGSHQPGL